MSVTNSHTEWICCAGGWRATRSQSLAQLNSPCAAWHSVGSAHCEPSRHSRGASARTCACHDWVRRVNFPIRDDSWNMSMIVFTPLVLMTPAGPTLQVTMTNCARPGAPQATHTAPQTFLRPACGKCATRSARTRNARSCAYGTCHSQTRRTEASCACTIRARRRLSPTSSARAFSECGTQSLGCEHANSPHTALTLIRAASASMTLARLGRQSDVPILLHLFMAIIHPWTRL